MERIGDQFLFTEKYRPNRIEDVILTNELKKTFQTFVDNKAVPNLMLVGSKGVGKCLDKKEKIIVLLNERMYKKLENFRKLQ